MFLQDPGFVHVGSCPVKTRIACRGLCIFLIISSLAFSPFEVVTSSVFDICTRSSPKVSPVYANAFFLSSASSVSLEGI